MIYWVAESFGALDLRDHQLSAEGYELVVTPSSPSPPQILWGAGAATWRRTLDEPIDDADADDATKESLLQLEALGLVSRSESRPSSRGSLGTPWLISYQHELVYALLENVAREAGIDIVFIKGPVLQAQGLRERGHSGDVDCWVSPCHEELLVAGMTRWGWTSARTAFDGTEIAHSRSLIPGEWGCEIDVHTRFPGVTVAAASAFEYVSESVMSWRFAGVEAHAPSRAVHAVIYALHELRPVAGVVHSETQRQRAVQALSAAGPDAIDAARALGAGFVLRDALREALPDASLDALEMIEPKDWRWRAIVSVPRRQLAALAVLPLRQRFVVFFRLLWPAQDASHRTRAARDASINVSLVKLKRLKDGLRRFVRGN